MRKEVAGQPKIASSGDDAYFFFTFELFCMFGHKFPVLPVDGRRLRRPVPVSRRGGGGGGHGAAAEGAAQAAAAATQAAAAARVGAAGAAAAAAAAARAAVASADAAAALGVGAGSPADLHDALEVHVHGIGELEGLEVGVAEDVGGGVEVLDLLEGAHDLGAHNAALLVHQLDGGPGTDVLVDFVVVVPRHESQDQDQQAAAAAAAATTTTTTTLTSARRARRSS